MQRARKARAKRGQTKIGATPLRKTQTAASSAAVVEERETSDRRLPGFDPKDLTAIGLTRREIAVLELVAEGGTNEAIATSLDLSPLTVKKHLERMSAKLGASNRAALVALAWLRSGSRGSTPATARRR